MSLNLERKLQEERRAEKQALRAPEQGPKEIVNFKTAAQEQAWRLSKIMEDPEKPVCIPDPIVKEERKPRAPMEFNPNVMGSTAGAGSGEFHVYRNAREKEFQRLRYMDRQAKKEKEEREFREKREALDQADNEATAKRRAKRQKQKQKQAEAKRLKLEAEERAKINAELKKKEDPAST
eukprot:m.27998 g.27998  ORF g.27998 m.27998 type:complete len:179 (-) comp7960_c0_seq1:118-654(-)